MSTIIVSLDLLFNAITAHIISQEPFGFTKTIFVCSINSPNKLKDIRIMLERNDLRKLALWFKNEYSLQHQKITVSLGPEIRKWLAQRKK
jgi:hypothetical protein